MVEILRNCRSWIYGRHRNAALSTRTENANRSLTSIHSIYTCASCKQRLDRNFTLVLLCAASGDIRRPIGWHPSVLGHNPPACMLLAGMDLRFHML